MLALHNVTLVDADGVDDGPVTVSDGYITATGSAPEDAEDVYFDDAFVAPGLVDAHVHLMMDGRPDPSTIASESESLLAYRAASNLEDAVSAGVTAVRDLGAPRTLAIDAQQAVQEGVLDGPHVHACGENIVMTGGHGHWFGREADGIPEVKKAVREQLKRGADVVKCMATGGVLTDGAITGAPELDSEELDALVATATAKRVPTAAHAHGVEGIKNAVRAGISSVEHGTFMDRQAAELMADRGTYWVPTAKALHGIVEQGVDAGIPAYAVEKAEAATDAFADAFDYALAADVPIAMGTDAGTPFNYHADIPEEIELLVEYGCSRAQALAAATVNAADLLGIEDVGLVAEGYQADLVVLDRNPLEDETAWQRPLAVLRGGSWVRHPDSAVVDM